MLQGMISVKRNLMLPQQLSLFSPSIDKPYNFPFPSTRYQGSKRGHVDWIWQSICDLSFVSVLDVFGGTGAVSHLFKNAGKQVTYNDHLRFNWMIGQALIENNGRHLTSDEVDLLLNFDNRIHYPDFIEHTFQNIYFTDAENRWLDRMVYQIEHRLTDPYKQALARFALFQACISKRPYNLFHRANLYMRTAEIERSFGNKTTWDTDFETLFRRFVAEANDAVFDNGQHNQALQLDAFDTPVGCDLVYLDPPYLNRRGIGVDYHGFYHFLEGLCDYENWHLRVDYRSKHRRLYPQESVWNKPQQIESVFEQLIARHAESILVISYRDDGIPSKDALITLLHPYKAHIVEAAQPKKYVLSNQQSHELLLIAC
jgi:adenine-specific DNA methylase